MKQRHDWVIDHHSDYGTRKHCSRCGRQSDRQGRWSRPIYWTPPDLTSTSHYEGHCEPPEKA